MADMKIDKGIMKSIVMLIAIVALIGGLYLASTIWGIVGGSIFFAVQNNTLPVTNGTLNYLGDSETQFFTDMGRVRSSAGFAIGLIAVAIILILFASFIKTGKDYYGSMKKKGGNSGDMGY